MAETIKYNKDGSIAKKRGRKPKQFKEELQVILDDIQNKEHQEFLQIVEEVKKDHKGEWDVTIDDDIKYFDSNLSYELTGYKPINGEKGLDFNPNWFTTARETFLRTGHYCQYKMGTKAFSEFWDEEYRRCIDGYCVNGYTITGDHYFFLNYYQLMDLTSAKKAGSGRRYAFSSFLVGQYEWFHYMELAKRLRLNACLMKSRMVGYSEIDAAVLVNSYNCIRSSVNLVVAHLSDHLNKLLEKVWRAMNFINDNTDGGFKKLRQVVDRADQKRASHYKDVDGVKVEDGFMSQITAIIADKPNKIRGDRTDLLIYEEAGSWPELTKAFTQADALVGPPGDQFGFRILGGTGGDSGPALEGLRKMYYKPDMFGILKYKHSFTQTGEEAQTAFFIPSFKIIANKLELADHRGWFDPVIAKEYYDKKRMAKASDPQELVTFCAEFCYNAEEAFNLEGDNKFNKVNIAEQLTRIRALKQCPPIEHGSFKLYYKTNRQIQEDLVNVEWISNPNGKVKILEHPAWLLPSQIDEDTGEVIERVSEKSNYLYVAGVDGIDIGADQTSSETRDPSDFCIVIKKRVYGLQEPQYVAIYKDRPNDIREAYKIAIGLMIYYNAVCNIEATRMSFVTWAREHHYLNWFMRRPSSTYADVTKRRTNQYGTPATKNVIEHQTDLIADFVNDYCHNIWFEEVLDELNRYSDDAKRKFDIIAALGMAELADEELGGVTPKTVKKQEEKYEDIGWYKDEKGYKHFGVIPSKQPKYSTNFNPYINPKYDDYSGIRTSDPRLRI